MSQAFVAVPREDCFMEDCFMEDCFNIDRVCELLAYAEVSSQPAEYTGRSRSRFRQPQHQLVLVDPF